MFGPKPEMQLYDRGIRRRLAPMLGGDRRRLSSRSPCSDARHAGRLLRRRDRHGRRPVAAEREPVRTPVQWSRAPNAGSRRRLGRSLHAGRRARPFAIAASTRPTSAVTRLILSWFRRAVQLRRVVRDQERALGRSGRKQGVLALRSAATTASSQSCTTSRPRAASASTARDSSHLRRPTHEEPGRTVSSTATAIAGCGGGHL
jgi:maltose alpha-D-glucosyltransferase/alpha-amylase